MAFHNKIGRFILNSMCLRKATRLYYITQACISAVVITETNNVMTADGQQWVHHTHTCS